MSLLRRNSRAVRGWFVLRTLWARLFVGRRFKRGLGSLFLLCEAKSKSEKGKDIHYIHWSQYQIKKLVYGIWLTWMRVLRALHRHSVQRTCTPPMSFLYARCFKESFWCLGCFWWTLTAGEFFDSKVVLKDVEEACHKKKVWPYIVASPHLGFMSLALQMVMPQIQVRHRPVPCIRFDWFSLDKDHTSNGYWSRRFSTRIGTSERCYYYASRKEKIRWTCKFMTAERCSRWFSTWENLINYRNK